MLLKYCLALIGGYLDMMRFTKVVGVSACLTMAFSCGKKSDSDSAATQEEGSSIVISGQLALSGEAVDLRLLGATPSVDDLSIYCVTFTIPPVAGTGDVNDDGSFSLTMDAYNVSVGCFINNQDEVLGTIVFKDPSKSSLNGSAKSADRLAFGGDANLGAITLDLTTGRAEVDISKIAVTLKNTAAVAESGYDFTGSYKAASPGIDLPKGYSGICTDGDDKDCRGPRDGELLWLKRVNGTSTADGSPVYGAMIWSSEEKFKTCGSKLGMSYDDAKTIGVDLSGSGIAEGAFTWTAGFTDGWKYEEGARARHSLMNMENVDNFNGYAGTKQYFKQYRSCPSNEPCDWNNIEPTVATGFSFYANTNETGCRDAAGKPTQLNDWSNMTCEHTALTGGLQKQSCSKEVNGSKVTCVHISGQYLSNGTVLENAWTQFPADFDVYANGAYCDNSTTGTVGVFDGDEWPMYDERGNVSCPTNTTLKEGDLCKDISTTTDAGKLAQLRCYADDMNTRRDNGEETQCLRRVETNWSAKTPDEFLLGANGPARADGMHIFELFEYTSPTSGSIRGEETYFAGIRVGDSWTDCEVRESFSLSLRKYEDSDDLLVEMISSEANMSAKPACIAEFGAGKTAKFMFKMIKQ
jgi:hypothetical protein